MNSQTKLTGIIVVIGILLPLVWNCKQKPDRELPKEKVIVTNQISSEIKEILKFGDTPFTDTTDVNKLIHFKEINESGNVRTAKLDSNVKLYKALMNSKQVEALPVFEIKNTSYAILIAQGRAYIGSVWAKLLVDRSTREIKKIQFEHKAESEGYGAGITQASFEDQFVGTTINLESNTFGLLQNGQALSEGSQMIDGISGATTTSKTAIDMLNEGLQKYRNYLSQ